MYSLFGDDEKIKKKHCIIYTHTVETVRYAFQITVWLRTELENSVVDFFFFLGEPSDKYPPTVGMKQKEFLTGSEYFSTEGLPTEYISIVWFKDDVIGNRVWSEINEKINK